MRALQIALIVMTVAAGAVHAAPGDQYILPILRTQDGGANGFQSIPGAGFNGSTAIRHVTNPGQENGGDIARIYWELNSAPSDPRLYLVEWWDPTPGIDHFHVVEEQFRGSSGEVRPIDPLIPWAGSMGSNHMFLSTQSSVSGGGLFRSTLPAHAPRDASFTAPDDGLHMWLRNGSQLYAKWDFAFGFPVDRTYAELRLTEIPEPATAGLTMLGMLGIACRRNRRRSP